MANLVQSAGNNNNSLITITVTLSGTVAGNTLIVGLGSPTGARTWTCADGSNGAYTIDTFNSPRASIAIARASGIVGGNVTISGTISGTATNIGIVAEEWNGIQTTLPFDQQSTTNSGATPAITTTIGPTATLAQTNEVAISVFCPAGAGTGLAVTPGGPPSWAQDANSQISANIGVGMASLLTTATTGVSATWSWTNSLQWAGTIATYKIGTSFPVPRATRQIVPGFRMLRAGGYYSD